MDHDTKYTTQSSALRRREALWVALAGRGAFRDVVVPLMMFNLGCLWRAHYGAPFWLCVAASIGWYVVFLCLGAALRLAPRHHRTTGAG